MQILGLDIGGANLKASTVDGVTASLAFPMWQQYQELASALRQLSSKIDSEPELVGLTMTAELADCFTSKADGVRFVIHAVEQAFPESQIRVWLTGSEFAAPDEAAELPALVAAANWHAQATWVARSIPQGSAILLDIGSTTTDIIPLKDGWPIASGLNDRDRLFSGELLYLGAARTPLCAVLKIVRLEGRTSPVAAEFFATMADAMLVVGLAEEQPDSTDTADGHPFTREHSRTRIARMLCCDRTELSDEHIRSIATQAIAEATAAISTAVKQVHNRLMTEGDERPTLVLSGSGASAFDRVLKFDDQVEFTSVMKLANMYHTDISTCACAFAVARLVQDRCRQDLLDESLF